MMDKTRIDLLRPLVQLSDGYGTAARVAILRTDLRDLLADLDQLIQRIEALEAALGKCAREADAVINGETDAYKAVNIISGTADLALTRVTPNTGRTTK